MQTTIYRWCKDYPDLGNAYLLAQEEHIDALVDEAGEIVDSEPDAQRARVRVDYRKWLASRLNRQKYGDKLDIQHNHTLDISQALALAAKRMESIGVGTPEMKLIEAENPDPDAM